MKGAFIMSDDWTRYREELLRSIGYEEGKRIGEAMVIRGFLKNFSPATVAEMFEVPLERVLEIKENEDYDDENSILKKNAGKLEKLLVALDYFRKLEFENTGGVADHLVKEALSYLPNELRDMVSDEVRCELLDMATALEEKCKSIFREYKKKRIESTVEEIEKLNCKK